MDKKKLAALLHDVALGRVSVEAAARASAIICSGEE